MGTVDINAVNMCYSRIYLVNSVLLARIEDLNTNNPSVRNRINNASKKSALVTNQLEPIVRKTRKEITHGVFQDFDEIEDIIHKSNFSSEISAIIALNTVLEEEVQTIKRMKDNAKARGGNLVMLREGKDRIMLYERTIEFIRSVKALVLEYTKVEFKRFENEYKKYVKYDKEKK